jgi:hypothetical protein
MVTAPVRGTQSFVGTLSSCWRRPALTGIEVAWRWSFGAPALILVMYKLLEALRAATGGTLNPARLGLDPVLLHDPVGALSADPMGAAGKFARAISLVAPGVEHFAVWLAPLLLVGWVVQSSVGRTMVLHRAEPTMKVRIGTVMGLQAIRIAALAAVFWGWFELVAWSSRTAVTGPIAEKMEPNLVLYCGMVIVFSLGLFTAWGFVSWVLGIAPLLAMLKDLGVGASLRAAVRLGPVRGKLVEINLVLGIVKIALIVLAMVFSACPLPFETVETQAFLGWWWVGVGVLYLVASDFFHVARLVGYLDLWREFEGVRK